MQVRRARPAHSCALCLCVSRALSHVSNNALLVGLAVQNAALSRKLKLKQPKRCVLSLFHVPLTTFLYLEKRWKEFVAVRSDANTMFDLCSDTESAKTIKALREVVDSLSARLRTGGLRSQHAAADVQALQKLISILESQVNGLRRRPCCAVQIAHQGQGYAYSGCA